MTIADRIRGLGVAIATPFLEGDSPSGTGGVDLPAFRKLVRYLRDGGADFLVVLGSTGEAATMSQEERDRLVAAAREERGNMPLVVGTGHNSTEAAVDLARRAAAAGAEALLVVVPYYNKPQPGGIEAHFRAIAAAVPDLPIVAYNVPGRTGLNLLPKDLARLWTIPQVVAVKESSGNLAQIGEIARTLPPGKTLLSGDDGLALAAIAVGAKGLISVMANVLPTETKALVDAAMEGRMDEARALHYRLLPVMDALFLETNPAPLKAALSLLGMGSDIPRLPLVRASEATRARLVELLSAFGLPVGSGGPSSSGSAKGLS
ncbi:MAG TPA: 4-hydroxy-tetrahydrodipicolinate synthase [Rectinemataceae bacterium]|nr:4-hydroxy-tetrahydrodipicolinate synthase [Rectinemataceae bacterium]